MPMIAALDLPAREAWPPLGLLVDELRSLYEQELAGPSDHPYLREHATEAAVHGQAQVFRWYWPWVSDAAAVLDWGCQHGPDSVMLRLARALGPVQLPLRIKGCDIVEPTEYQHFRARSSMEYTQLRSRRAIPFDDHSFDAVIAAGVLEHVESDFDSLRELHRVLRPNGRLIVTYLPNIYSWEELVLRRRRQPHHERLYSRSGIRRMLLQSGFRPLTPVTYQAPCWQRQIESVVGVGSTSRRAVRVVRTVLPLHVFRASTLCVVAERADGFL
jgi:SAM-dependent methyltransferase